MKNIRCILFVNGTEDRTVDKSWFQGDKVIWRKVKTLQGFETALRQERWDFVVTTREPQAGIQHLIREYQSGASLLWYLNGNGKNYQKIKMNGKMGKNYQTVENLDDLLAVIQGNIDNFKERQQIQAAQKALLNDVGNMQMLLNNAAHPVIISNESGIIIFFNTMAEKLLGYQQEEILGKTVNKILPGDFCELYIKSPEGIFTEPRVYQKLKELEFFATCKAGKKIPVEISISQVKVAGEIYRMSMLIDITRRKHIENALRESETRYRRLFEDDLTGNFLISPNGEIVTCNPAFARIFGFASADAAVKYNFFALYPDEQSVTTFLDLLRQKRKLEFYEVNLKRYDGNDIYVVENVVGLFDEQGDLTGIRGYLFDVSERKRVETLFRQTQKMETLGMLVSGIVHDFNNLLSIMNAYSEIMLMKVEPQNPLRKAVEKINETSKQAGMLIQQILTFARKQNIQPVEIYLNEVVAKTSDMLERLIGNNIRLNVKLHPKVEKIRIDPVQLKQVLINLAVNARDAMPEGGELNIETCRKSFKEAQITVAAEVHPENYAVLQVRDMGAGIADHIKDKIFEPFFTTKDKDNGTGLGLATVHSIVEQNHGKIEVLSEMGKGTCFRVYFPEILDGH